MSYNGYNGMYAFAPMIYDIAAAQYLYGANTSTNSGNDTYDGGEFDGSKKMWTIWDADGVDEEGEINIS